jgi:hypothetical protein
VVPGVQGGGLDGGLLESVAELLRRMAFNANGLMVLRSHDRHDFRN